MVGVQLGDSAPVPARAQISVFGMRLDADRAAKGESLMCRLSAAQAFLAECSLGEAS